MILSITNVWYEENNVVYPELVCMFSGGDNGFLDSALTMDYMGRERGEQEGKKDWNYVQTLVCTYAR